MIRKARTYLSVVVTAVLLVLVLRQVGIDELATAVRNADFRLIALAFVIGHVTFLPKVLNWQQLLRAQGHELPYLSLFRLYLVGVFFNNMLPTNVGGDVVRSYEVGRRINDQATGLATVFVERLSGLIVLVLLATAAFLTHLDRIDNPMLTLAMVTAWIGLVAVTWAAVDESVLDSFIRWTPSVIARQLARAKKAQVALHRYRGRRRLLANSIALSLMFNAGAILYMYVAVSAFQSSVSILGVLFVVPITMIVGMTPFTINGAGLQEWACVVLFPRIGVPESVALSAMLLIRAITLVTSVFGGLLYLHLKTRRHDPMVAAMQPSSGVPD